MKEKKLFIKNLNTLFFSWGMDTPDEVIWGANELLDWFEKEYGVIINNRFKEMGENFDDVIKDILNS